MRATQRLIARGFEAYLVGGCVRDLLLDRSPKDYDIATEARPPQVKRTFPRNCRIIGRRFKLAHLHFNNNTKILEVSTFRRTPQLDNSEDDLLITRDNEFGTAEEDALRRDFTVNALFLDPTRNRILDYTNGLADLRDRVIRTIGDPRVRFREDPVRILRAAKFAGRLGFSIEPETFAAMAETSGDLVRAAPPRVLEEILRLLRGGHALDSFQLLRDVGALKSLVPVLADFLGRARHDQRVEFWRLLEALDHRVNHGRVPPNAVLLGVLFAGPVLARAETNPGRSPSSIAEELLGPLGQALRLPRRDAGCLKRICGVQHRFSQTDESKRFRVAGFVQGPYFDEALELFELRMLGSGAHADIVRHWQDLADGSPHRSEQRPETHGGDEGDEGWTDTEREQDGPSNGPVEDREDEAEAVAAQESVEADDETAQAVDPLAAESRAGAPTDATQASGAQADDVGDDGRRRRRRRRRRGRGRSDQDFEAREQQPSGSPQPGQVEPAGESTDVGHADVRHTTHEDATPLPRRAPFGRPEQPRIDFAHPEGADDRSGEAEAPASGDAAENPFAEQGATDTEPGRRRRRRRRRGRRGRRDGEGDGDQDRFPPSEAPAPHGEATDAEARPSAPLLAEPTHLDPDAPATSTEQRETAPGEQDPDEQGPDEQGPDEQDHGPDTGQTAADGGMRGEGDERRGRRRRRRGRRGRGRDEGGQQGGGQQGGGQQRGAQPQSGPQPQGAEARPPGRQPSQRERDQRPNQPQQPRNPSRHERRQERRDQRRRGGQGGHGGPRDVDVVPRYRDRRGKVDVIEPPPLDLSAFDVELDPKRVPTFGSIVEGKNRPKKRSPRVPEDGVDDYRPPPPPGSDSGPSAPPPPPPNDAPDTFGDW